MNGKATVGEDEEEVEFLRTVEERNDLRSEALLPLLDPEVELSAFREHRRERRFAEFLRVSEGLWARAYEKQIIKRRIQEPDFKPYWYRDRHERVMTQRILARLFSCYASRSDWGGKVGRGK